MAETAQDEARLAVEKIQTLDPRTIARTSDLGPFALNEAIEPLGKLVRLFEQIPTQHIAELPDQQANQLRDQANAVLNRVRECDEFDPKTQENPSTKQQALVTGLEQAYPSTFSALWHHIGYLASRERDFAALELQARSATEAVKTEAARLQEDLENQKNSADEILADIKKVAAEPGVSQQAIHFSSESVLQGSEAEKWEKRTAGALVAVILFGILTIFMHRIPFLAPNNTYDTIQLAVSKVVIFAALFYALTLCARNYFAHRHSQAVNKHRQNALATYKAIADAASDEGGRDIVLSHAADCIFSPQETGYLQSKRNDAGDVPPPTLQVMPRIATPSM